MQTVISEICLPGAEAPGVINWQANTSAVIFHLMTGISSSSPIITTIAFGALLKYLPEAIVQLTIILIVEGVYSTIMTRSILHKTQKQITQEFIFIISLYVLHIIMCVIFLYDWRPRRFAYTSVPTNTQVMPQYDAILPQYDGYNATMPQEFFSLILIIRDYHVYTVHF